jgi:hypothetical protein
MDVWEHKYKDYNDEIAFSYVIDGCMGGWKGIEHYAKKYEANFCKMNKNSPYPKEFIDKKNFYFIH